MIQNRARQHCDREITLCRERCIKFLTHPDQLGEVEVAADDLFQFFNATSMD